MSNARTARGTIRENGPTDWIAPQDCPALGGVASRYATELEEECCAGGNAKTAGAERGTAKKRIGRREENAIRSGMEDQDRKWASWQAGQTKREMTFEYGNETRKAGATKCGWRQDIVILTSLPGTSSVQGSACIFSSTCPI
jgi:hypothetical protein